MRLFATLGLAGLAAVAAAHAVEKPAVDKPAVIEERAALPTLTLPGNRGVLVGTTTLLSTGTAVVNKYIGVPYAASPVRFSRATSTSWTTAKPAQTSPPACIQVFNGAPDSTRYLFDNPGGPTPLESEDCLTMNIYTSVDSKPGDNRAVMVLFPGGSFTFAYGSAFYYDGASFAYNQGVIQITVQSRNNIFGFPGSPQVKASDNNLGLYDVRLALDWIQKNIVAFGGDPTKVTIYGESSGGAIVKQLIAYPPDPRPFRAAILQSSGARSGGNMTENWFKVVNQFQCGGADPISCMRKVDPVKIKNYLELSGTPFFPNDDGLTYTSDFITRLRARKSTNVPVFIGTTANEARAALWIAGIGPDNAGSLNTFLAGLFPDDSALRNALLKRYEGQNSYIAISAIATNIIYTCPTVRYAQAATFAGLPVYRYYESGSFPNLDRFPLAGAYHSSDLPLIQDTVPVSFGPSTEPEKQLSRYLQTTWANFVRNPGPPQPGWRETGPLGILWDLGGPRAPTGGVPSTGKDLDAFCQALSAGLFVLPSFLQPSF